MHYHAIAVLPGNRQQSLPNKTEEQMLTEVVIPFVSSGVVKAKWGTTTQTYQVIELRIYKTDSPWYKKSGEALDDFLRSKKNIFNAFEKRAKSALSTGAFRVFVVMPIQGEKYGSQDEQRIHKEYDQRFEAIEKTLGEHNCVAIRIDKEHPLEDIVGRIKSEIKKAHFVVADLTDERPSCYFEAGYSEALEKPTIYVASKDSVTKPNTKTHIHFDIHMNVHYFTNHNELCEKLESTIKKNSSRLFHKNEENNVAIKVE